MFSMKRFGSLGKKLASVLLRASFACFSVKGGGGSWVGIYGAGGEG
jgi:hypothetical protein